MFLVYNLSLKVSRELLTSSVQFSENVLSVVVYVGFPVRLYPIHLLHLPSTLRKFAHLKRQRTAGQFYGNCRSNVRKNGALPSVILELKKNVLVKIQKATSFRSRLHALVISSATLYLRSEIKSFISISYSGVRGIALIVGR